MQDARFVSIGTDGVTTPLQAVPVASSSVVRTDWTYTDGLLTGYTEHGVVWTITRNPDGSIASVTHA